MDSYDELEVLFEEVAHLDHVSAMLLWDEAVMMPEGSGDARTSALSYLARLRNETLRAPDLGQALRQVNTDTLSDWQAANVLEMRRRHRSARAVDPLLVERRSRASMSCEQAWRKLRPENNWTELQPLLEEVVALVREEAVQRGAASGMAPYDALLDLYDPGQTEDAVRGIFDTLKGALPPILEAAIRKQPPAPLKRAGGPFPVESQCALGLEVVRNLGFDFNRGRLDVSHHPFCGGVPEDVRMTTRYGADDFVQSLMDVIHETGHALYEQNLPRRWSRQPVGRPRGMAMHESQSLFFEMQVARTEAFLRWLKPTAETFFPTLRGMSFEAFESLFLRVKRDYIRIDADEITYPFHVMLRFELEGPLVRGEIQVRDLPKLWNEKMVAYLGLSTLGNDKDGCMQDVHWPGGGFGYFPSYTMGAIAAAQLFAAAKEQIPGLLRQLEQGDLSSLRQWLDRSIWSRASAESFEEIVRGATGRALDAHAFIDHLQARYLS